MEAKYDFHPLCLYPATDDLPKNLYRKVVQELEEAGIEFSSEWSTAHSKMLILIIGEEGLSIDPMEELGDWPSKDIPMLVVYTGTLPLSFSRIWRWLRLGVEEVYHLHSTDGIGQLIKARLDRWAVIERVIQVKRIRDRLIGNSPAWLRTIRQAVEIACFSTAPVLILGESGTGKELVARLIHDLDKRPDKQELVLLDCTTIVPELSGSEFFGHEKGAFTNAMSSRDGAFALANRGSLFLDEIGELPMSLQSALLRVIQEGVYKRVGSNIWKNTQFRLISATNRKLEEEVESGNFRQDLYHRIKTCVLQLPPLRDRAEDLPILAQHFLQQATKRQESITLSSGFVQYLQSREFPGNIRELKQLMTRIAYRYCGQGPITLGAIPPADRGKLTCLPQNWQENGFRTAIRQALLEDVGMKELKRITGNIAIEMAMEEFSGNIQMAAKKLSVSDRLVQTWMAEKKSTS
ncbi:MAG: sigma 54-interacting transcriptional regulator [Bacteroidota bacterium]